MELLIADKSPVLGYGIAVAVRDQLFIHGGIPVRTTDTSPPSNSCHIFDCTKQVWKDLTSPKVPALSFHAAFVTSDRFVHLVGGWNGKSRSSCVYIYDMQESIWLPTCKTIGFPNGAGNPGKSRVGMADKAAFSGLSGHTAAPIADGGCLITGRLGGLQTQRRSGCVLTLIPVAFPSVYRYEVLAETIQSRSGHTCTLVKEPKKACVLLGGRDQDVVELLHYGGLLIDHTADPIAISDDDGRQYHRTPLLRPPSRRYHIAVPVYDRHGIGRGVLMHGGESFASTAKGPTRQGPAAVVLSTDPRKAARGTGMTQPVYGLDECEETMPRLTGHQAVRIQDKIFIVGGFGDQWQPNRHLYRLAV